MDAVARAARATSVVGVMACAAALVVLLCAVAAHALASSRRASAIGIVSEVKSCAHNAALCTVRVDFRDTRGEPRTTSIIVGTMPEVGAPATVWFDSSNPDDAGAATLSPGRGAAALAAAVVLVAGLCEVARCAL